MTPALWLWATLHASIAQGEMLHKLHMTVFLPHNRNLRVSGTFKGRKLPAPSIFRRNLADAQVMKLLKDGGGVLRRPVWSGNGFF